jgi:hypothetical protein
VSGNSRYMRLLAAAILAASLPLAVHADEHGSGPAVSGFNTKFSAEGGVYDDESTGLVQGSLTTPLGQSYGFQLDGIVGSLDDETLGGGAVHLFTRDPSRYLFGVYGSYHSWDSIDITRLAAEAELYRGRMTLSGIAGWEDINVPGTKGGLTVTTRDDDHFFTELDLSFYPQDNMRISGGYRYESEESLGAVEFEYMPQWQSVPMSIFATGNFGDDDHTRVTGGIRFYFGAERNKSLIRRHREDDPGSYNPIFPNLNVNNPNVNNPEEAQANICPTPRSFLLSVFPGCTCPDGGSPIGIGDGFGSCDVD